MERKRPELVGRYEGFKGHFDSGVFVFESMEERDRYQIATYGQVRNGWREPDEPTDSRPLIVRGGAWKDESERLTYEHAMESNPKGADEGPLAYIMRIAGLVQRRRSAAAKDFPKPDRLSPVEYHKRQVELGVQGIAIQAGAPHEYPDMPRAEQVEEQS